MGWIAIAPALALRVVKATHTLIWLFFVACIIGMPVFAWRGDYFLAATLCALVLLEVAVLVANRFVCPLTAVARKYTDQRTDNFDIYLPLWLARYNKQIFGTLFIGGGVFTVLRWRGVI
jgi:hypothetical protein